MNLPSLFRNVAPPIATRSLLGALEQGDFNLKAAAWKVRKGKCYSSTAQTRIVTVHGAPIHGNAWPSASRLAPGPPSFNLRSSDWNHQYTVGLPFGSGRKGRDRNSDLI